MLIDFHTHRPLPAGAYGFDSGGLHPWQCAGDTEARLTRLDAAATRGELQLIGECGLDRCCTTPWSTQTYAFEQQLLLAERHALPVVIHCVRAYNEVLALRLRGVVYGKRRWSQPWILHGFASSSTMAQQLQRAGLLLSFGHALLSTRGAKVREALRSVGQGAFLLETDEAECTIDEVYAVAADVMGVDVAQVEARVEATCRQLGLQPRPSALPCQAF